MTKSQMKFVAESYAKYFGRAADADTIKEYGLKENGKPEKTSEILKNIIADAKVEKTGLGTEDFVNNAFQNLFNRNADTIEMNKYSKVIEKGKDLPINSIVKSAAKTDKAVYNNKMAVAVKYAELGGTEPLELNKISKGNLIAPNFLNTVTKAADLQAKVDALADKSGIPSSFDGKPFVLTEGVDTGKDFIGTNKDDQFIADNSATVKSSVADTIDGGKGIDTFKVYVQPTKALQAGELPTLKNVENVVIYDNTATAAVADATNFTKWDTVESVYLVRDKSLVANTYTFGAKTTTVNLVDNSVATKGLTFDAALTSATLGVDNVFNTTIAGAAMVTVNGTALKTLTLDASGKASNVNLTQATTDTIETLNITGKADLTLAYTSVAASKIVTIDGSKAEGKLNLDLANTTPATLKTVKTGTADDKLTVSIAVASGTTINLGAGNDKLVKGAGSVVTSTTTVIDGGAGIDTLDASLVTVGNAGVFANFETLSLTSTTIIAGPPAATALDLDLLTKSTFTTIALDSGATTNTLLNVKKSQSLTVNAAATATTLTFKASEVAGTADAYTINFNADSTAPLDAGTVGIAGIETININSVGKTGAANTIDLKDADAKSVVITGNTNLTIEVDATKLGTVANATNGLGVSTIDASASTAGITIAATDFVDINTAWSGLTIKGGAGADSITTGTTAAKALTIETGAGIDTINLSATTATDKIIVNAGAGDDIVTLGATGGTFTLGAGKDTIDVKAAAVAGGNVTVAAGAIKTTITDIEKGDIIKFTTTGTFTQANVSAATDLDSALTAAANGAANTKTWFQYAGNTYVVDNVDATAGIQNTDVIVKLNGLVDLSNSSLNGGTDLTIA